jgi:hypothetical protein
MKKVVGYFGAFLLGVLVTSASIYFYLDHKKHSGGSDLKFDSLTAKVVAPSNYLVLGNPYRADIFLSGSSSALKNELVFDSLDNTTGRVTTENGISTYEVFPETEGIHGYKGSLKRTLANGEKASYSFEAKYMVVKPAVIVKPAVMELHRNLDNKLDIGVPGISSDDLIVDITNGTIGKSGKQFIIKPGAGEKTTITVFARLKEKNVEMGEYTCPVVK